MHFEIEKNVIILFCVCRDDREANSQVIIIIISNECGAQFYDVISNIFRLNMLIYDTIRSKENS